MGLAGSKAMQQSRACGNQFRRANLVSRHSNFSMQPEKKELDLNGQRSLSKVFQLYVRKVRSRKVRRTSYYLCQKAGMGGVGENTHTYFVYPLGLHCILLCL